MMYIQPPVKHFESYVMLDLNILTLLKEFPIFSREKTIYHTDYKHFLMVEKTLKSTGAYK